MKKLLHSVVNWRNEMKKHIAIALALAALLFAGLVLVTPPPANAEPRGLYVWLGGSSFCVEDNGSPGYLDVPLYIDWTSPELMDYFIITVEYKTNYLTPYAFIPAFSYTPTENQSPPFGTACCGPTSATWIVLGDCLADCGGVIFGGLYGYSQLGTFRFTITPNVMPVSTPVNIACRSTYNGIYVNEFQVWTVGGNDLIDYTYGTSGLTIGNACVKIKDENCQGNLNCDFCGGGFEPPCAHCPPEISEKVAVARKSTWSEVKGLMR
jgi:hypothetical protein